LTFLFLTNLTQIRYNGTVPRISIYLQLRLVLLIMSVVCLLVALFPDSPWLPFQKELQTSRTPQAATQAVRWLFAGGALIFAGITITWRWIRHQIVAGIEWIARWPNTRFWLMVWGLGFGLRLPIELLFPQLEPMSDALWYHNTAIAIAEGKGLQEYGTPTAYRPPGYSTLLAITYRLFGPDPHWAWFWGILSIIIIVLTTYLLAKRLYGTTIARIATLVIAIYPALILYTGQPMSDLVFVAGLMLVWCVILLHPSFRWFQTIGIGIALGLLTLTRSVAIGSFLIVPILWFLQRANRRHILIHSILLTLVFVACLILWLWRNYVLFGTLTLGTNMGLNLYIGSHSDASGTFDVAIVPAQLTDPTLRLNEAQVDQIFLQEAITFATTHPTEALLILPRKVIQLYLLEVTAAESLLQNHPLWLKYGMYGVTQIFYLPILILFVLRALNLFDARLRPQGIQWTGWLIAIYFTLLTLVFFGVDRYRLPFFPWMIIEASVMLLQIKNDSPPESRPRFTLVQPG